jgi:large conductance mechanosensitive channel
MKGFIHFLRTQGIAGLAIGFIIGTAAQQFVQSFSKDIVSPIVGKSLGAFGDLRTASSTLAGMTFGWGNFISELVNLVIIALVVYLLFTALRLNRLDERKQG